MSLQDPIADMLTRIRNGQMATKVSVSMPSSTVKMAIAKVLKDEGYISDFNIEKSAKPKLTVELKYHEGKPVITKLERVSRPGLRTYKQANDLPKVLGGLGIAIISTPKGIMTGEKAQKEMVGGEMLFEIA